VRYRLVAIGKLRRGFYQAGCEHYRKRLRAYAEIEVIELKEASGQGAEVVRQREGAALLEQVRGKLVALDERGKRLGSLELAEKLSAFELRGISQLTLLIGGAEGLSDEVKRAARERWSLSSLTLPHELARLVLLEQLYRAETIRAGHPYHRE
jgi:23S rRNA (pseudouridine1915-N3)-methyltransferase